jgi:hypothetical protein
MTRPAAATSGTSDPRTGAADRWISRAAVATVAGLAGIAGAISYSHMRQLALDHGQAGWHTHAFPLSVDGIEIVASLVLLADRRAGRKSGWLPWTALAIGTAGSLAANVATAGPGIISRVIAGWPALALLIAVKLLSGMLDQHGSSRPAAVPTRPEPAREHADLSSPVPVPAALRPPDVVGPDTAVGPAGGAAGSECHPPSPAPVPCPGTVPDVADLLPVARAAWDGLLRDGGRPVTRDGLAAWLRASRYPVRNARLTPLLRALRSETPAPEPAAR